MNITLLFAHPKIKIIYLKEGEFGTGERTFKETKKECKRGDYKNTKFVFYKFEYESMTDKQKKLISKWTNNLSI